MIKLLFWGHGKKGQKAHIIWHKHEYCQLEIIFSGSRDCLLKDKVIKLHQGDAFFIPMNVLHKFTDVDNDLEYISLKFRVDDVDKMPRRVCKLPHDFLVNWLTDDFKRLVNDDIYKSSPLHLRLMTYLTDALFQHLQNEKPVQDEPELLNLMRRVIFRYGVTASVGGIAEEMQMNITQFRREFKRVMKTLPLEDRLWKNPSDFLKYELTRMIAVHLRESKINIGELAEMFRFSNVYTFSRYFKVNTGYSPSAYRKKFGGAAIVGAESFPEQLT